MKKFQVTISFELDDDFMSLVPAHRTYVNHLITKEIIEHYAVSMETNQIWITLSVKSKRSIDKILRESPLYKYFKFETAELFVLDGRNYRLPTLQMN